MHNIFGTLANYLEYSFVKYAIIAGVLISLCSSLLGVTLVLKRYSFIGDGLSHVAFGALAIATVLRINNDMIIVIPLTVLSAILILCTKSSFKIKGDSALAMISVGALAIGYLLLNVFPSSSNISGDVCGTLFGSTSILTLTSSDVWLCSVMSIIVITLFLLFYDKIFTVTFDESFAAATGIRVAIYNSAFSIICAVIVVLSMNLVGSLLTSALIVFPAVSAMRICKSFRGVIILSAILSVICSLIGILASILLSLPVGSSIVVVDIIAFTLCCITKKFMYVK